MLATRSSIRIGQLFKVIGDPFRVRLLLALAKQEACVCHLECLLGKRQAYISQHLMCLREAGILAARREGKYIFYKIKNRKILGMIDRAAEIAGMTPDELKPRAKESYLSSCECPQCGNSKLVSI